MAIVAGDILRTSVNFELADGTQYQNIFHHKRTGVALISDATFVASLKDWVETMYAELVTLVDNDVTPALCSVDKIEWVVDAWEVVENVGTFIPTFIPVDVFAQMPNQLSPYVMFKTDRPKTVGRKFLFPLCEDGFDVGLLTAAAVTALTAWASDALNDIIVIALNDLVPGVPRTAINAWYEFTHAVLANIAGTQRRRKIGVGA